MTDAEPTRSILPPSVQRYIGMESEMEVACEPVDRGAVRRYAQAIMDEDPIFRAPCETNIKYGGPVAPLIFPMHMFFARDFGAPDVVAERAADPEFDGSGGNIGGLPPIDELKHLSVLNGGSEMEFFRYARHGETIRLKTRYSRIYEKQTSKGPMVFVEMESDYTTGDGEVILRMRRTLIRR